MADPTITARLKLDTSGYQKGVSQVKGTTSSFTRIRDVMAGVFGGNLLTAAASKAKDFFTSSIQGAVNAERANTQFKTSLQNIVGATDQQVKAADAFLTAQSKNAAVAKGELRPAYETLLRGTHSLTGAQDALKTALDVSAGTGRPLAQVATAITKGFMGSTGGLQRMGVATKDASGKALSMQQIMQNLNKTFGGQAAKQADTTAGRMKNLSIQFNATKVSIGQALLPIVTQLAEVFQKLLGPLQAVASWAKNNPGAFQIIAGVILGIVVAVKAWNVALGIAKVATVAWTAVNWLLNSSLLANPITWIVLGIAALVAALILAYQKVGWFRAIIDTTWQVIQIAFHAIVAAGEWVVGFFRDHWQLLLALIGGPIGIAVALVIRYWDQVKAAAMAVVNFVLMIWHGLVAGYNAVVAAIGVAVRALVAAFNWLKGPIGAVVNFLKSIWNGFVSFIRGIAAVVRSIANGIGAAFNVIGNIVSNALGVARRVIDGFVSFFRGVVSTVGGIARAVGNAIAAPINAVIGVWNGIHFRIPQVTLPSIDFGPIHIKGPTIGGQEFRVPQIPKIPRLASGGYIATEGLAFLHAGELVTPAAQVTAGPAGPAVVIQHATFSEPVDVDLFMRRVAWSLQTGRV